MAEEFGFGDATFTVLCPETDLVSSDDTNDASVGIKLVHGENSFVMCGDAGEKSESAMVKRFGSALECDVLKCGHHGSRTSTSEVFLKATNQHGLLSAVAWIILTDIRIRRRWSA